MGMLLSIPMILVGAWMVWRGIRQGPGAAEIAAAPPPDAPQATPQKTSRKTPPGADEPA
jgi:hypothetical protein